MTNVCTNILPYTIREYKNGTKRVFNNYYYSFGIYQKEDAVFYSVYVV